MAEKAITYRALRNTPGQVFERLARGEPLPLVAEGVTKAILIPVEDGDVATVLEAWPRGRALLPLGRLQESARRRGTEDIDMDAVDREVAGTRKAGRRRGRAR